MESNKDLLLCENKFFVEENKFENCLNFSKKDNKLTKTKDNVLKTEKLTSNGEFGAQLAVSSLI